MLKRLGSSASSLVGTGKSVVPVSRRRRCRSSCLYARLRSRVRWRVSARGGGAKDVPTSGGFSRRQGSLSASIDTFPASGVRASSGGWAGERMDRAEESCQAIQLVAARLIPEKAPSFRCPTLNLGENTVLETAVFVVLERTVRWLSGRAGRRVSLRRVRRVVSPTPLLPRRHTRNAPSKQGIFRFLACRARARDEAGKCTLTSVSRSGGVTR